MSHLRRLIGERMHQSSQITAPVTLCMEVDTTELVSFRTKRKESASGKTLPSYNAIIMMLVGQLLLEYPQLNCSIDGNELIFWKDVNIGIAVDTPRGLVVPVIKEVQKKSLLMLTKEIDELARAAISGKILPDQFQGGTFTITNLGMYDIDFFTPIINYPQVGILGIGHMKKQLVMQDGGVVERSKMFLSLTFDHRAIDGAPASKFLKDIKQSIENPNKWVNDFAN